MSRRRDTSYPLRHREYVRGLKHNLISSVTTTGIPAILLTYWYLRDWFTPVSQFAPLAGFIFVLVLFTVPGTLNDIRVVAILPYFKKVNDKPELEIRGNTFLSGHALARHCEQLDDLARRANLNTISDFGFADDLAGEEVVWHDAARGLETVSALLQMLHENPVLIDETQRVIDDLSRIEKSLQHARELGVPFCFLLRHGSVASGHEMEVRRGVFAYS